MKTFLGTGHTKNDKKNLRNYIGKRFGRLTVVKFSRASFHGRKGTHRFVCACVCGKRIIVPLCNLLNRMSDSCGWCSHRKWFHPLSPTLRPTWHTMIKRCYDKKLREYKYYGARGINVCDRWLESLDNFCEDVGKKPTPNHSLDRINNDGNYEPSNCRWATWSEQGSNKRPNCNINLLYASNLAHRTGYSKERIRQLSQTKLKPFILKSTGKRTIFRKSSIRFLLKLRGKL